MSDEPTSAYCKNKCKKNPLESKSPCPCSSDHPTTLFFKQTSKKNCL